MWAGFEKLDVQVLGRLSCGFCSQIDLRLNNLLLLFFKLVDEIACHFEHHSHELASDCLAHHVLELDFLAYQVDSGASLTEEASVEFKSVDALVTC